MATKEFASEVWILEGWTESIPGRLALEGNRLRLTSGGDVVFDVTPAEVSSVTFPWYYFGGGMKLCAAGKPFRLSFVPPNGSEYIDGKAQAYAGNPAALGVAVQKFADVRMGRGVGRRWRAVLGSGG